MEVIETSRIDKNNKKFILFEMIFICIFYLIIGRLLIHSGDDWAWGGQIGLQRLNNHFDNYNGRYIGNIVEMLITRNMVFRVLFYSVINSGIVYLLYKLSDNKIRPIYSFSLMLLVPIGIYQQTYGWLAGFANYNVSTFLLLLLFYLLSKNNLKWWNIVLIGLVSFINQFFVENVSIASVVISVVGFGVALIQKKRIIPYLTWIITSIGGFLIMFSNSAYHQEDNMRGLSNIDWGAFSLTLLTTWSELFIKENGILLLLFSIVLIKISNRNTLAFVSLGISSYFFVRGLLGISFEMQSTYFLAFEFLLEILYVIILIVLVIISREVDAKIKVLFFYYLASSVILLGPFLVLTPFGPRNVLTSYVLLVVCLLLLVQKFNLEEIISLKAITVLAVSISGLFILLHGVNKVEESKRIANMKVEVSKGKKEIEFKRLPFEFLGHDLTPKDGSVQSNRQKMYHNIPKDIKFNIIEFKK